MGWGERLAAAAKAADRLSRLRRWTHALTDAQLLQAAGDNPDFLALVKELRPHLAEAPRG